MNIGKKICPKGKILNEKTSRCVKEKKKKLCPEGKILNEKTGRCMKEKKKKVCPEGKVLNEKTNRCVKEKKGEKLFLKLNLYINKALIEKKSDPAEIQKINKEMKVIRDKIIKKGYEKELKRYDNIWGKILLSTDSEKKEINDLCEIMM